MPPRRNEKAAKMGPQLLAFKTRLKCQKQGKEMRSKKKKQEKALRASLFQTLQHLIFFFGNYYDTHVPAGDIK